MISKITIILCLTKFFCIQSKHLNQQILFNDYKYTNQSTFIYLNDQMIEEIDSNTFSGFLNLQILWLSNNKIRRIDELAFKNLKSLKEIWLERNDIISFNKNALSDSKNLKLICLNGNPISLSVPSFILEELCSSNPMCVVKIKENCVYLTTKEATLQSTTSIRIPSFEGFS